LDGHVSANAFKYDPFGRRIYKSFSTATSIYAYDGGHSRAMTGGGRGAFQGPELTRARV